jgi:Anti-sigma-K factor rskA
MARERLMKQVGREKKIVPITRTPVVEETRPVDAPFRTGSTLGIESSYLRAAYVDDYEEEKSHSFASKVLPWAGWAIAAGMSVAAGDFYHQRNNLQTTVATNATQLAHLTADAAAARQLLDTLNDTTAMRVTLQKPLTAPVPQARATYVADKGSLLFIASNMEPLLPYKVYELWLIPADGRDPIPAGTFHPDQRGNATVILPTLPKGVEAKAFGVTVEDEGGATTPTLPIIMAGA